MTADKTMRGLLSPLAILLAFVLTPAFTDGQANEELCRLDQLRPYGMQLDEALHLDSDIRQQMARSEVFRGYWSITVGLSGAAGLSAAALQPQWVASPEIELERYLGQWRSRGNHGLCPST